MCGITGYVSSRGNLDKYSRDLSLEMISHRGPDGRGFYHKDNVFLGHTRLSIIDVEFGNQPLKDKTGQFIIIYNGELYNYLELKQDLIKKGHLFRTTSDTEVVLNLYIEYGHKCLEKMNGIFAFSILDKEKNKLFLARDNVGVKPLYYIKNKEEFFFGSEIKPVMTLSGLEPKINLEALSLWLSFRHVPSPHTLFDGIQKLEPGHYLLLNISTNEIKIKCYWTQSKEINQGSLKIMINDFQNKLELAVESQMMADVPIGLMLSGGVDSALIGSIMKNYSSDVKTYTVGFKSEGSHNELEEASETAKILGLENTQIILSDSEYLDFFEKSFYYLEEPIATSSAAAFHLLCKRANQDVKVLLCGQGSDEPMGGYGRHLAIQYSNVIKSFLKYSFVRNMLKDSSYVLNLIPQRYRKVRRTLSSFNTDNKLKLMTNLLSINSDKVKRQLLLKEINSEITPESVLNKFHVDSDDEDLLNEFLKIDLRHGLADDLLLYGDKMGMAASVEVRVPFLDKNLVSFMESIPGKYKIKGGVQKYFLKQASEKYLPDKIINRKKKGFETPIESWFRRNLGHDVRNRLCADGSACSRYFNVKVIKNMFNLHILGRQDYKESLYGLYCFEMWHETFFNKQ